MINQITRTYLHEQFDGHMQTLKNKKGRKKK